MSPQAHRTQFCQRPEDMFQNVSLELFLKIQHAKCSFDTLTKTCFPRIATFELCMNFEVFFSQSVSLILKNGNLTALPKTNLSKPKKVFCSQFAYLIVSDDTILGMQIFDIPAETFSSMFAFFRSSSGKRYDCSFTVFFRNRSDRD